MYEIKKQIIKFNNPGTVLSSQGVVIHETANPNDTAQMEWQYFNSGNRQASAHFFVDAKEIVQCIDTMHIAWHAGPTANNKYWGIEMCHSTDPDKFKSIWEKAVWLTAILLTSRGIKKITQDNLLSHAEVSARWGETDHRDPISYFRQHGKTMEDFRKDAQKMIDDINKPAADDWKLNIVRDAFSNGLIKDCEQWMRRVDEPMPVWAVLAIVLNSRKNPPV